MQPRGRARDVLLCGLILCLASSLGGRRRGGGAGTPLLVYGVTPAEATLPSDQIYVQGRGFDVGSISVTIEDPADPFFVPPTVAVVDAKPHSLRVSIPDFSTTRSKYRLVVRRNGNAATATTPFSESLYLRSSGSAPPSETIWVQYVNWGWTLRCSGCGDWPDLFSKWEDGTTRRNSNHCAPTYVCGCNTAGHSGGFDGFWHIWPTTNDWTEDVWPEWKRFSEQTSRDWSTTCSEAWNPTGAAFSSGLQEVLPRVTLINNHIFWLDLGSGGGSREIKGLARGGFYTGPSCNAPGQLDTEESPPACFWSCAAAHRDDDDVNAQPACDVWTGSRPDVVVVHLVGAFFEFGQEVDPRSPTTGIRAVTNPPPSSGDPSLTTGMIVITDNKMVDLRANPDTIAYPDVPWVPGDGCLDNLLAVEQRGWWGPSESRDSTPNAFSHELVHLFGQLHRDLADIPDPSIPDRVLVGFDLHDCTSLGFAQPQCEVVYQASRRGYRMDVPPIPDVTTGMTTEQACSNVVASPFTQ